MIEQNDAGKISLCKNANYVRRQDVPAVYELNGAIYGWKRQSFLASENFIHDDSDIYIMPAERSIDIDTEFDFRIARLLMESVE